MRHLSPLLLLVALAIALPGCRPVSPTGLPRDPGQALHTLAAGDLPGSFSLSGRLRTAIAGVDLDLGLLLLVSGESARLEIDLPFGGRAMTVVLGEDGSVLCTTLSAELAYYSEDADELARVLLGEWAEASDLVDVLTGRLPTSFGGDVAWHRRGNRNLLALSLPAGRVALVDSHRRPKRMRELLLLAEDETLQGHGTWDDWTETEGVWFPGQVRLTASDRVGSLHVIVRHVDLAPRVRDGSFDTTPPDEGYQAFDELLRRD